MASRPTTACSMWGAAPAWCSTSARRARKDSHVTHSEGAGGLELLRKRRAHPQLVQSSIGELSSHRCVPSTAPPTRSPRTLGKRQQHLVQVPERAQRSGAVSGPDVDYTAKERDFSTQERVNTSGAENS